MTYYADPLVTLLHGDCLEVIATLPADSVDAVVTDPPYGLEFMGKEWDSYKLPGKRPRMGKATGEPQRRHTGTPAFGAGGNRVCRTCGGDEYRATPTANRFKCECDAPDFPNHSRAQNNAFQAWCEQWGREALRVTKPGGYLLAFGGTRTHHRLVCALEDAGWIIRDELTWIYACLSDDTEILTGEGWVPYNRVNVGDYAAAFDRATGRIQWEPVEAVHVYHHEGEMVRLVGDGTDQLVTPNHRLVLVDGQGVDRVSGVRQDVLAPLCIPSEVPRPFVLEALQRNSSHPRPAVPAGDESRLDRGVVGLLSREHEWTEQSGLEGRRYYLQEARQLLRRAVRSSAGVGEADGPQGWVRDGASATDGRARGIPVDADRMREPREPRPDRQSPREPHALAVEPRPQAVRVDEAGDHWCVVPTPVSASWVDYAGVVWCVTVPSGSFLARRRGLAFVTGNSGFPKGRANLKPAHEPIVLARKPGKLRELGIEACRIGHEGEPVIVRATEQPADLGILSQGARPVGEIASANAAGRWPSNLLLSDPELFDEPNPYVVGSGATVVSGKMMPTEVRNKRTVFGQDAGDGYTTIETYGDSGGYSRFFIVPKSPRHERNRGLTERSSHPTVKPIDLMRHLVRLVTPVGGTVLDPFLGSGTTCLAASEEGFRSIGVERELEYLEIAKGRLMATPMGLGLDVPAGTKKPAVQRDSFAYDTKRLSYRKDLPGHGPFAGPQWKDGDEEPAA